MWRDTPGLAATSCPGLVPECTKAMRPVRTDKGKGAVPLFQNRRCEKGVRPLFVLPLAFVALLAGSTYLASMQSPPPAPEQETAWVCPMHPDYTMDIEGKCPRCGMALVRAAPFDVRDYRLDFRTVPALVKPGVKTTLLFSIFHPGTGEPIKKFEVVHERQYHLFLISQDMEYFQHIHPVE